MTEKDLQRQVILLCRTFGLVTFYEVDSRWQHLKGWPDLVIIGPRAILYRELKGPRGNLTKEQRKLGALILRAGGDWGVWRPADLYAGIIKDQLAMIAEEG